MPTTAEPLKFNFHNIVAARVFTDQRREADFFTAEYNHHLVTELPEQISTVSLHFHHRSDSNAAQIGSTQHSHKFLARWRYRIEIRPAEIEMHVTGNRMAVPMIHHMLLHPSLRYLASQKGFLLLHSGAVVHQGRSLIFTGQGGAGKTTTTSLLLSEGGAAWLPHADDYVFLQSGPETLAYLTRSHLYRSLLDWVPELRQRLTTAERLRIEMFGFLRKWSREGIKWPVRLPIERLWPGRPAAFSAQPVALVNLTRANVPAPRLRLLGLDESPLDELIEMNFREARHFLSLLEKAKAVPDLEAWISQWKARERLLLEKRLQEIPVYLLELPMQTASPKAYRQALAEKFIQLIPEEADSVESFPASSTGR